MDKYPRAITLPDGSPYRCACGHDLSDPCDPHWDYCDAPEDADGNLLAWQAIDTWQGFIDFTS